MGLKIVNGAWGTLAGSVGTGDVTINVTAGHGTRFGSFSAGDYMYATLIKGSSNEVEYIKITARSTDALTAVRGLDGGSGGLALSAGDRIECRPVNAAVRAAVQELGAIELAGTDTYTGTLDPVPTAYNTRQLYVVGVANTNTSLTPTVNLNSLGAKTIKRQGSTALVAGDLPRWALLMYDGTDMILLNPSVGNVLAPIVGAKLSSPQAIADVTQTVVIFGSEDYDPSGIYNTGNGRVTPNVSGKYRIKAQLTFANSGYSGTKSAYAYVAKNGSLVAQSHQVLTVGNFQSVLVDVVLSANGTTDYFEIGAYQDTGVSQNLENGNYRTTLFVERIG